MITQLNRGNRKSFERGNHHICTDLISKKGLTPCLSSFFFVLKVIYYRGYLNSNQGMFVSVCVQSNKRSFNLNKRNNEGIED